MSDDWWNRASCLSMPVNKFVYGFQPKEEDPKAALKVTSALAVCRKCPVIRDCAQDLADTGDDWPYQVRAGIRYWKDADQLPAPRTYDHEPPANFSPFPDGRSPDSARRLADQPDEVYTPPETVPQVIYCTPNRRIT